ncbi:MAG: hypothetical protein J7K40_10060 [candidate division Zixibacteria bacterium]|nr:hypothetical protein [candidate division Zixibacteria bacterium]
MNSPIQYDLLVPKKKCRCGGQLEYNGRFYICSECNRVFCPDCFGYMVSSGGCLTCISCGWSLCA